MEKGQSRADKRRELSRAGLIEQLKNKGLVQQVIESNNKLADLSLELTPLEVTRIKSANDTRMALVKKYLPDVKQMELVGEDGENIKVDNTFTVEFVNASPKS